MSGESPVDDGFEARLRARLHATTQHLHPAAVSASPALTSPRTRRLATVAAFTLVVTAVVGAVVVRTAGDDPDRAPSAASAVDVPHPSTPANHAPDISIATATDTGTGASAAVNETASPSSPAETFPASDGTAKNFLIVGIDNEACIDPDSPYAPGLGDRSQFGERSDTIMILRLDPEHRTAAVLSLQRDLWVPIAGGGRASRLNSAYVKDDPRQLIDTILQNFGIGIDHFVQIDFCAFKNIVDSIGGVTMPFEHPIRDQMTGLNVPAAGCFTFDGDHALAYVRSRQFEYLDEDGRWRHGSTSDLGRVERQQDFLNRVLAAASDAGLTDPSIVRAVVAAVLEYVVVDTELTVAKIITYVGAILDIESGLISGHQLDVTVRNIAGNQVLIPDLTSPSSQQLLTMFRGAPELAAPVDTTAPPGPRSADEPVANVTPPDARCP